MPRARPRLHVLVGMPACGKTTIAGEIALRLIKERGDCGILASDEARRLLTGSVNDFSREADVWGFLQSHAAIYLASRDMVIDATNLVPHFRKAWLDIARANEVVAVAYPIFTPFAECVRRNDLRSEPVPDEVMERMYRQSLIYGTPQTLASEGFVVDHTYFEGRGLMDVSRLTDYEPCETCGR